MKKMLFLLLMMSSQNFAQEDIHTYAQNGDVGGICYLLSQDLCLGNLKKSYHCLDAQKSGATALMGAAYANEYEAAALLLAEGANVNIANHPSSQTVLMFAAIQASPELVKLLVESGANINAKDSQKQPALLYAVRHNPDPNVVRVLLDAGALLDYKDYLVLQRNVVSEVKRSAKKVRV